MRYVEAEVGGAGLDAYLRALAPTRANGGTKLARLRAIEVDDPEDWFPTGSLAATYDSLRGVLLAEAARRALPDVLAGATLPPGSLRGFAPVTSGTLLLDGVLASMLANGGAYHRFAGSAAEAKRLAGAAAHDLIGDRYEDIRVLSTDQAWSPWFFDVAWDAAWLLVDDARLEVTILVTTDTD